jgi:hypothetical protein
MINFVVVLWLLYSWHVWRFLILWRIDYQMWADDVFNIRISPKKICLFESIWRKFVRFHLLNNISSKHFQMYIVEFCSFTKIHNNNPGSEWVKDGWWLLLINKIALHFILQSEMASHYLSSSLNSLHLFTIQTPLVQNRSVQSRFCSCIMQIVKSCLRSIVFERFEFIYTKLIYFLLN